MTHDVSSDNFDKDVLEHEGLVLVDFWAEWCPPCRALSPIIEKVAKNSEGKASVVKVNVDENPDLAMKYGVRGIPTTILFQGGRAVETIVGLRGQSDYEQLIAKHT